VDWRWKRSEREVGSESERESKNGQAAASYYETVRAPRPGGRQRNPFLPRSREARAGHVPPFPAEPSVNGAGARREADTDPSSEVTRERLRERERERERERGRERERRARVVTKVLMRREPVILIWASGDSGQARAVPEDAFSEHEETR